MDQNTDAKTSAASIAQERDALLTEIGKSELVLGQVRVANVNAWPAHDGRALEVKPSFPRQMPTGRPCLNEYPVGATSVADLAVMRSCVVSSVEGHPLSFAIPRPERACHVWGVAPLAHPGVVRCTTIATHTKQYGVDRSEPLVDAAGFPRSDVDVHAIRIARNEIAGKFTRQHLPLTESARPTIPQCVGMGRRGLSAHTQLQQRALHHMCMPCHAVYT